jgi:uncharacterized protein (DUF433 family)
MNAVVLLDKKEPWRPRLLLPAYQIGEAARYSGISPQTVTAWHRADQRTISVLPSRDARAALSYLQLIEVAIVAALRKRGMTLARIRAARDYIAKQLKSEYPFAEHKFKTEGKHIWLNFSQLESRSSNDSLVAADLGGQLAWTSIVGKKLEEFEYHSGLATRWRLAGKRSRIVIDPQIAFGAPSIKGTPTWTLLGRWKAKEPVEAIAEDFSLNASDVKEALIFEGIEAKKIKLPSAWTH